MRGPMILGVFGFIVMGAGLVYGFTQGGGWGEVRTLVQYPWFNVSLVDVYIGFALFSGWIAYRERPIVSVPLIIAVLLLGNIVSCAYVIATALRSRDDWRRFWMGRHAERETSA